MNITIDLANILWWVVVGLVAGLLASAITHRRGSILSDIVLGIIGAFVGGFILSLFHISTSYDTVGTILAATLGAIVLIVLVRAFEGRNRTRTTPRRRRRTN